MNWKFPYTSLLYRKGHKLPHETHDNLSNLLKISDNIFGTCSYLNKWSLLQKRSRQFDDTLSLLLGIDTRNHLMITSVSFYYHV